MAVLEVNHQVAKEFGQPPLLPVEASGNDFSQGKLIHAIPTPQPALALSWRFKFGSAILAVSCLAAVASTWGGTITGVGIILGTEGRSIVVKDVVPKSPAASSGHIRRGDRIIAVGQGEEAPILVSGLALTNVVQLIRGPTQTVVRLTVIPAQGREAKARVVSLIRGSLASVVLGSESTLSHGDRIPNLSFPSLAPSRSEALRDQLGKVVVLEFWATWCLPCLDSLAAMQALVETNRAWSGKVAVFAVNVDADRGKALAFVRKKGWTITTNVWADQNALNAFGVTSLPMVLVVDRRGRLAASGHGLDAEIVRRLLREE